MEDDGDMLLQGGAASHDVEKVIYLSCGFPSFMRDYDLLVGSGVWEAVHCEGFIFFPGADHIETLAVFCRVHKGEEKRL